MNLNKNQTFTFETVQNDPSNTRIYTLENGLKIYLSQNFDEPKIQTYIAVKTGSNNDPEDTTGLAHYFEHMMFKGNSKIGTKNWEKEKPLLDQLELLFEEHRKEENVEKKAEIYQKIDKISFEASQYAIPNEYDKLASQIGASGVNAHTSYNETIYYNTIPKNELEKWAILESSRFSEVALRLFHTELETVYEEYNRSQDNDSRLIFNSMMENIFPNSKYGTQTVLGSPKDLKSPSMKAIYQYFDNYYVANNMAIIMVGDLDFDETIALINHHFGQLKKTDQPTQYIAKEINLEKDVNVEVFSPSADRLQFAFRMNGMNSSDAKYIKLIDVMLNNSIAGLIDLNINQLHKAQSAGSGIAFFKDYGLHIFAGSPKDGQTLEEVKNLILDEIENIKNGNFDDWLIEAVVNDFMKSQINSWVKPSNLGSTIYRSFINEIPWENVVNELDEMKKITKEDLMNFTQKHYQHSVCIYKRKGENKNLLYVESPKITPIQINRDNESEFFKDFKTIQTDEIEPKFVDFDNEIIKEKINDTNFYFIPNKTNSLANVYYLTEVGKDHLPLLNIAIGYLDYAATNLYNSEELSKEFYKIGLDYDVIINNERSYIHLNCLEENLTKGIALFEHFIQNILVEDKILETYIEQLIQNREIAKNDKSKTLQALSLYAKYGSENRQRTLLKTEEIKQLKVKDISNCLKEFFSFPQEVIVYANDFETVKNLVLEHHQFGINTKLPKKRVLNYTNPSNKIFFAPYDMVQTEVNFFSKDSLFDSNNLVYNLLFNEYIGSGLSSVVFQEIRESKSLAYSARAYYETANKLNDYNYLSASIGTQPDKLQLAVETMNNILNEMPRSEIQFDAAKTSLRKMISSKRFTNLNIFFYWISLKERGLQKDMNQLILEKIDLISLDDFENYYKKHISNKEQNLAVIGKKENVWDELQKLNREIIELSIEEIFNF